MILILFDQNDLSLQRTFLFYPNSSFLCTIYWPLSLLEHVNLSLCNKDKLRVANAETNIVLALIQLWVLCTLTHGKAMS